MGYASSLITLLVVVADEKNVSEIVTKSLTSANQYLRTRIPARATGSPQRQRGGRSNKAHETKRDDAKRDDDGDENIIHINREHSWSAGQDTLTRAEARSVILELAHKREINE